MLNLAFRSIMVLALLFGLLFAAAMMAVSYYGLGFQWAVFFAILVIFLQYLIGPFIMDWIYKINWVTPKDIDEDLAQFIEKICREKGIPVPRFGIIEDGNPNAFTYGHHPGDSRLVVTKGLLDILDKEERKAVVGHELGHICHWDFVVMTLASIIPLILFLIYDFTIRSRRGSSDRDRGGIVLVGLAAYVAYVISQYIVLFLSRVREYYADQFSSQVTGNPNSLASSLVKIAYGLAKAPAEGEEKKSAYAMASRGMGIFDPHTAGALALNSAARGSFSTDNMVAAMRWDLWNPWALFYELVSTHPLPAKRILLLEKEAKFVGEAPIYDFFETQPESYWDEFVVDLIMNYLPLIGIIAGALALFYLHGFFGLPLIGWGIGYLFKILYAYPRGEFKPVKVENLVGVVKVSAIRSYPVQVEGEVIGRGIPGIMWSKDFILQDESGFIPIIYKQPVGIWEFLFGLTKAGSLIGKKAKVKGWYRRHYSPMLEIWNAEVEDEKPLKCYFYGFQIFLSAVLILLGALLCLIRFTGF